MMTCTRVFHTLQPHPRAQNSWRVCLMISHSERTQNAIRTDTDFSASLAFVMATGFSSQIFPAAFPCGDCRPHTWGHLERLPRLACPCMASWNPLTTAKIASAAVQRSMGVTPFKPPWRERNPSQILPLDERKRENARENARFHVFNVEEEGGKRRKRKCNQIVLVAVCAALECVAPIRVSVSVCAFFWHARSNT